MICVVLCFVWCNDFYSLPVHKSGIHFRHVNSHGRTLVGEPLRRLDQTGQELVHGFELSFHVEDAALRVVRRRVVCKHLSPLDLARAAVGAAVGGFHFCGLPLSGVLHGDEGEDGGVGSQEGLQAEVVHEQRQATHARLDECYTLHHAFWGECRQKHAEVAV